MKINNLLILLSLTIISCKTTNYPLPSTEELANYEFGSYIELNKTDDTIWKGELIAIDSSGLVILNTYDNKASIISIEDIESFTLFIAEPEKYGWTIPVYTLSTISHGFLLMFTAPLNLIVTTSVTLGGYRAYQITDDRGNKYYELNKYARFLGGIPQNINIDDIKRFE